jgi:hypothetical protein
VWEELPDDAVYGRRRTEQKQRKFSQLVTPENPAYLHGYAESSCDREVNVPTLVGEQQDMLHCCYFVSVLTSCALWCACKLMSPQCVGEEALALYTVEPAHCTAWVALLRVAFLTVVSNFAGCWLPPAQVSPAAAAGCLCTA